MPERRITVLLDRIAADLERGDSERAATAAEQLGRLLQAYCTQGADRHVLEKLRGRLGELQERSAQLKRSLGAAAQQRRRQRTGVAAYRRHAAERG
ncbi:MAG: hypothetical protein R3E86_07845 [Pseudomonadales bacterium]